MSVRLASRSVAAMLRIAGHVAFFQGQRQQVDAELRGAAQQFLVRFVGIELGDRFEEFIADVFAAGMAAGRTAFRAARNRGRRAGNRRGRFPGRTIRPAR